jgi:hypothetical protein
VTKLIIRSCFGESDLTAIGYQLTTSYLASLLSET